MEVTFFVNRNVQKDLLSSSHNVLVGWLFSRLF